MAEDAKLNIIISAKDHTSGVFKSILGGLKDIGKIATGMIVGDILGGAIRTATQAIPDMIAKASNMNETVSKVGVIFGESADDINAWASTAATRLGQTKQQAMDAASTFATFGKASGLAGDDLVDFSTTMGNLSSDLASFHNTSPEEAITALGAALRGESEPIRRFGVLLDDATLRQKALELGLVDTVKNALTPQQRALAAYQVILDQTKDAQGDFARTSGGLANQQKILTANMDNLKTTLGTAFLPIVNQVVTAFNQWFNDPAVQEGIQNILTWLGTNLPIAMAAIAAFWTNSLQPALSELWTWLSINLPPVIAALAEFWNNVLLPAIQAVWAWMQSTLIPFLQNVVFPWLAVVIPQALQLLADFWNNILLPAIKAVWKFLSVDMKPVWEALIEFLKVAIPLAITVLVGFWDKVLKPALDAIWKFISTYILPIFKAWSDSIGGISGAIETVVWWINTMTEMLKNIKLPDWLTPGSPTPFEIGLRGIADAMKDLSKITSGMNFAPTINAGSERALGTTNNRTNNWNLTINEAGRTVDPAGAFAMMRALAG